MSFGDDTLHPDNQVTSKRLFENYLSIQLDANGKVVAHLDKSELKAIAEAVVEQVLNRVQQFEIRDFAGGPWRKVLRGYVLPNGHLSYQNSEEDQYRYFCVPNLWRPVE